MKLGFTLVAVCVLTAAVLFLVGGKMQTGSSYYVDSKNSAASDEGPGSKEQPWKSLEAINSRSFAPGDTIHFAANSVYTGTVTISSSGNPSKPIVLTRYKDGNKPSFSNTGGLHALVITGSYVRIDGLDFRDTAVIEHWNANSYMESGAVLIQQDANHVTVTNSEFSGVGVGVKTYGLHTTITRNDFHDLVIAYSDQEQSYGAIGVSLNHSNAEVSYNHFINCRSTDSPYGADGGAIEIEGYINDKTNISIHHNISSGSQGFIEVTETRASQVAVYQNVSDDYQQFIAFDTTVTPSDFSVEHNTVVRTKTSNVTALFTVLFYREEGPDPEDSWLNIRNNIFYSPAAKVLNGSYSYKFYNYPHSYNLFF
ncbi:hypothetical protein [Paenibacillus gorillae]|uniref:hypothetical protein n=1 Tax=Paenibacillus gorillae TaxID=1243662 RepID=UPI0004AE2BD5|nr:hypothetical protein [Paenibacillus gorillae]